MESKNLQSTNEKKVIQNPTVLDTTFETTVLSSEVRRFRLSKLYKQIIWNTTVAKVLGVFLLFITLTFGWQSNEELKAENQNLEIPSFYIEAESGITGQAISLRASSLPEFRPVEFEVTLPSGQVIVVTGNADQAGVIDTSLSGLNTGKAGVYTVSARSLDLAPTSTISTIVRAGAIQSNISQIDFENREYLANGKDEAVITVTLRDRYGNPIPDRSISLHSSYSSNLIIKHSRQTNAEGIISFGLRSFEAGEFILTALDDENGRVFSAQKAIKFVEEKSKTENPVAAIGGDDRILLASNHDLTELIVPEQSIQSIQLSIIESEISVNTPFGILVEIVDTNGNPDPSYTGTIHFSSNNTGAVLPSDFTFASNNQGSKSFDFGVSFPSTGSGQLSVMDLGDNSIRAELNDIIILPAASTTSQTPIISSPQNDSKTNQKNILIQGTALRDSRIVVYDGTSSITETVATAGGTFEINVEDASDGSHQFTVVATDPSGNVSPISNSVKILVDTIAPTPESAQTSPRQVGPVEKFKITVISEENLAEVKAVIDKRAIILNPSELSPTIYEAEVASPETPGDYPIDIILSDEVGNTQSYKDEASLLVEGQLQPVSGVLSIAGNESVFISWDAVDGAQKYKVYYGKSSSNNQDFIITDSTETSGTITGLDNDSEYSISVVALDAENNESSSSSVSQTSTTPSQALGTIDISGVTDTPESGPGLIVMLLGLVFAGFMSFRHKLIHK